MGYNSVFSGSLTPSKPIPKELATRINDADLAIHVVVAGSDAAYEYKVGNIAPWSAEMHGYDWGRDIVKVQRLLAKHGITLRGDIERSGEEAGDFDKVEVRKGKIYYRRGRVMYGKREEMNADDVTMHAIRVFRISPKSKYRFVGWVAPKGLRNNMYPVCPALFKAGTPVIDRPPVEALRFKSRSEARAAAHKFGVEVKTRKRMYYDVVSWEDAL
jgi:hypothetical protein